MRCLLQVVKLHIDLPVKEEKLLYLAMESQDDKQMMKAVKTIIRNCTNLKSKAEDLATFEIEFIFLKTFFSSW